MTEDTHDGRHTDCPPCFAIKVKTVQFAASAMPSRNIGAVKGNALDKQRERDLPAYKRLVDSGVQPPTTYGAADLEAGASTKIEVELGRTFGDMANRVERAQQEISEAMQPYKKDAPDP